MSTGGENRWWGLTSMAAADPETVWARGSQEITYARLRHEVAAVRDILTEHGIGAGSVVALQVTPSFGMLWWLFGLWAEGAQALILDARMTAAETTTVLDHVRPNYVVRGHLVAPALTAFVDDCGELSVERRDDPMPRDPRVTVMMCSSGTTGTPKVVVRTGDSVLADIRRHAANPGMTRPGERVFLLSPPTHGFGLFCGVLLTLYLGGSLVFPDRVLPDELMARACEADVQVILGVPAHFGLLSQAGGTDRPRSLRLAASCGDVLPDAVAQRFSGRYGVPAGQFYGMSEFGVIATDLAGEFTYPEVGRVLPGIETRIVDGELYIETKASPYLDAEYQDRYADGWLRTYDRAEIAPGTNVLTLRGRADSVRIIGGLKVDLTEIESVLRAHPQVSEALALFRAAEKDGPPPMLEAYVAAEAVTEQELTAWCRERLSAFKVPRRWHIGADIPRTAVGKADRSMPTEPR
ncbi:class I adenylate-forming enzyme family protein [Nocardia alni]|uniref:class I adenylate-forming enzyme family protein n=1 Tax=Nocardia alni TaxID=2815723 RepID=UPI001C22CEE1|nr:class I adenylate-forming enzyme family protein [Nocardia alni]